MTSPVLRKCPKCGRLKLRRLISGGAGVIFKGSGFYETDYKRSRTESAKIEAAEKKASESSSSDGDGSGDGSKSESAPAKADASAKKGESDKRGEPARPEGKPKKKD